MDLMVGLHPKIAWQVIRMSWRNMRFPMIHPWLKKVPGKFKADIHAAKKFLGLPDRPTAIFAANDLMALGAIYAIQDAGLNVPKDIAVVGYDDREIASYFQPYNYHCLPSKF